MLCVYCEVLLAMSMSGNRGEAEGLIYQRTSTTHQDVHQVCVCACAHN